MRGSRPGTRLRMEVGVLAPPSRAVGSWGGVMTILDLFPHPEDVQVSLSEFPDSRKFLPLTLPSPHWKGWMYCPCTPDTQLSKFTTRV